VPSSIPKTSVSRGRAYHCRADADSEVVGPRIHRDRAIAKLAAHQRGVVTRDQLREIGMTSDTIDHWLGSARLHSLYRGVYLLGHAGVTDGARELGAVLACGPGAVLSYRSAAWLWRLLAQPSEAHDVTVPGRKLASRRGIRIHWVPALDPATSEARRNTRHLAGRARFSTSRQSSSHACWSKRSPRHTRDGSRAVANPPPCLPAVHPVPAPAPPRPARRWSTCSHSLSVGGAPPLPDPIGRVPPT
jgi:hypothetical protein